MNRWEPNRRAQSIARAVLERLGPTITEADSEASIAERAVRFLAEAGVDQTWYHDCPALVLLGSRSCASVSGRHYEPSSESVGRLDLVTVDLSPCLDGAWGDCARSFAIESGRFIRNPETDELRRGLAFERQLHDSMRAFVTPETTFEQLHEFSIGEIVTGGYENLDANGNLGHSIESRLEDRVYIEPGNSTRLSDAGLFTFEPHIRAAGGRWGFKRENIYYFDESGRAVAL